MGVKGIDWSSEVMTRHGKERPTHLSKLVTAKFVASNDNVAFEEMRLAA